MAKSTSQKPSFSGLEVAMPDTTDLKNELLEQKLRCYRDYPHWISGAFTILSRPATKLAGSLETLFSVADAFQISLFNQKGEFKPEYAGKMNFYCSAVDDLLRHTQDSRTIGLILCQSKDKVIADYALRDVQKSIGIAHCDLTRALPKELSSSLASIEITEAELSTNFETGDGT